MFIMQVLASQLPFLANRNAEQAVPPLFWPVNCIKIGRHVALLSDPTVYSLYCDRHHCFQGVKGHWHAQTNHEELCPNKHIDKSL